MSFLSFDSGILATPSDTVAEPSGPFAAFVVWTTGTVSFVDQAGNASGTSGTMPIGTLVRCKGQRINLTGTTATILLLKTPA